MWLNGQNLNTPRYDKDGRKWNFRVWHDAFTIGRTVTVARVFFWDEVKETTGVVLLGPDIGKHVRDLHGLIQKLVASKELRAAHQQELRFPLERHYADYGAFPEESNVRASL
jgi:hypothetical protein